MKKWMAVLLAFVFIAGSGSPVLADKASGKKKMKKYERIVAYVDSVDVAARTMAVTREENGEKRTISISEKAASKVQVGDRVRIKLKPGTNESAGVLVLGPKPGTGEAAAEPGAEPPSSSDAEFEPVPAVKK